MDIDKLKNFIMVVEKKSISKAAIALNMTQPPLSISIRKFEEELGVDLFKREGKKLILTEAGKLLYRRGNDLIFSSQSILKELQEKEKGKTRTITVGCSTIANLTIIPEVVKRLNNNNENIIIKVLEGNTAFVLEQLRLHKMDIGLVRNIFNKENIFTTALLTEPIYLALPPGHPLIERDYIGIEELKNENFLMPYTSFGIGISDLIIEHCQTKGFNPKIIYWGTETLPMLNMVNNNLGIAFVPFLLSKVKGYTLPPLVKLKSSTIQANLNLVTLKDTIHSSATEIFLNVTKDVIYEINKGISL